MKKLLIIGHACHGKDTLAEVLQTLFNYTFQASSVAASEIFLYDVLKVKYGYKTPRECFEDRGNHRKEWHDAICEFNKDDKAALAKHIMRKSDIYVGMRSDAEIESCLNQGLFDLIIGIFDNRKPLENRESFDIDLFNRADIIIPNCGTITDLKLRASLLKPLLTDE